MHEHSAGWSTKRSSWEVSMRCSSVYTRDSRSPDSRSGSVAACFRERHAEAKRGPGRRIVLDADVAAVRGDDGARDREADAGALRLRREERIEEPRQHVGGDAGAQVFDRNARLRVGG